MTISLDREPGAVTWSEPVEIDGRTVRRRVEDVAGELPALLAVIHDAGLRVEDVRVEAPSLHAVFIHLTGRELRE